MATTKGGRFRASSTSWESTESFGPYFTPTFKRHQTRREAKILVAPQTSPRTQITIRRPARSLAMASAGLLLSVIWFVLQLTHAFSLLKTWTLSLRTGSAKRHEICSQLTSSYCKRHENDERNVISRAADKQNAVIRLVWLAAEVCVCSSEAARIVREDDNKA